LAANGPPPTEDQVVRLVQVGRVVSAPRTWASPQADRVAPYREQITAWLQQEHLPVTRVQALLGQRGVHVPYTTLELFVWRLGLKPRGRRGDRVRMAPSPPGAVAVGAERGGAAERGLAWVLWLGARPVVGAGLALGTVARSRRRVRNRRRRDKWAETETAGRAVTASGSRPGAPSARHPVAAPSPPGLVGMLRLIR